MKRYVLPMLIILFVPVFLLLVKMISELEKALFGWQNADAIVGAICLLIIAIVIAVGLFAIMDDETKKRYF